jgi:hypothetical protein
MVRPNNFDEEKSAVEEIYNGEKFDQSLKSLGLEDYSLGLGGDVNEREFVMAHIGKWGSPLYSKDEICCVYEVYNRGDPIDIDSGKMLSDILEERPRKLTQNYDPVPSLKGEYLNVMKCSVRTDDNDIDYLRPQNPSYWIPIEWVRQSVQYDEEKTVLKR